MCVLPRRFRSCATLAVKIVYLLLVLTTATTLVCAQLPHFEHIILIVQENRTPDNLFGAAPAIHVCGNSYPFETGVDIRDGGPDYYSQGLDRCLVSQPLNTCWDVGHFHTHWNNQADIDITVNPPVAKMDKACGTPTFAETQNCAPPTDCPQYSFVQKSNVQPYFDIATNYGFANYMFQTNQGPSFPAHQFLLSGTSAPTFQDSGHYYLYFVGENAYGSCESSIGGNADWVDFLGGDFSAFPSPYSINSTWHDCYDHPTLVDQLQPHGISWRYYSASRDQALWTAVNAIHHLCYKDPNTQPGAPCDTDYWKPNGNMSFPAGTITSVPVLTDIDNCQLQQVSWVTPDERWSDHAGGNLGLGPSYVADIVDAIGNSGCTDSIGTNSYTYWQDTAIFIVWDDWGGWYDHVAPPANMLLRQYQGKTNNCTDPRQIWGCGYTYGFRVPLLVVSAYTPAGYVSGNTTLPGGGFKYPYIHDFGSILRFIEKNFSLNYVASPNPYYADYNAPDKGEHLGGDGNIPLSDFFQGSYRIFTNIQPAAGKDADYFTGYFGRQENQGQAPEGPDGDDAD